MSDLPPGWVRAPLGEVAEVRLGRQRSPKNHTGPNMRPYLRAANVNWDGLDLTDVKEMNFTPDEVATYALRPGDVVMSEASGSADEVGKPAVWTGEIAECCFQNTLIRVRGVGATHPGYLLHRLRYEALLGRWAEGMARGVGIHHLGSTRLAQWPIELPPLAEQSRIVDEVERRLSLLDAAIRSLDAARRKLAAARPAILEAAVLGRLLPQQSDDEPVDLLLKRAEDARATALAAAKGGKPPDPLAADPSGLPSLPATWQWASLDALAHIVGGVTKDSKRQHDPAFVAVPYLRVANVQRGWLNLSEITTIRVPPAKAEALRLRTGDVLFNEGGDRDKLGRGWVWEGQIADCIHQNHVFRARLYTEDIDPKFLSWFGNSVARGWFESAGKQTTNLASINLTTLKSLPVPVPPGDEQNRIVTEVERKLSLLDATERAVKTNLARADLLRMAILRDAFAGRLLPQDAADAPADELLTRIHAARTDQPTRRRRGTNSHEEVP